MELGMRAHDHDHGFRLINGPADRCALDFFQQSTIL